MAPPADREESQMERTAAGLPPTRKVGRKPLRALLEGGLLQDSALRVPHGASA